MGEGGDLAEPVAVGASGQAYLGCPGAAGREGTQVPRQKPPERNLPFLPLFSLCLGPGASEALGRCPQAGGQLLPVTVGGAPATGDLSGPYTQAGSPHSAPGSEELRAEPGGLGGRASLPVPCPHPVPEAVVT